jgi:hypothetical protein
MYFSSPSCTRISYSTDIERDQGTCVFCTTFPGIVKPHSGIISRVLYVERPRFFRESERVERRRLHRSSRRCMGAVALCSSGCRCSVEPRAWPEVEPCAQVLYVVSASACAHGAAKLEMR